MFFIYTVEGETYDDVTQPAVIDDGHEDIYEELPGMTTLCYTLRSNKS